MVFFRFPFPFPFPFTMPSVNIATVIAQLFVLCTGLAVRHVIYCWHQNYTRKELRNLSCVFVFLFFHPSLCVCLLLFLLVICFFAGFHFGFASFFLPSLLMLLSKLRLKRQTSGRFGYLASKFNKISIACNAPTAIILSASAFLLLFIHCSLTIWHCCCSCETYVCFGAAQLFFFLLLLLSSVVLCFQPLGRQYSSNSESA